jgi:hypothetical protein
MPRDSHRVASCPAASLHKDAPAMRLRGLQVDYELELGRLLNRQVRRLGALENRRSVDAELPVDIGAHTIAQQSAGDPGISMGSEPG